MNYIEISVSDAKGLVSGKKSVLVSTQDLEEEEENIPFVKMSCQECEKIIGNSEKLVMINDDFVNQIRAFTHKQKSIFNIERIGKLSTILIP